MQNLVVKCNSYIPYHSLALSMAMSHVSLRILSKVKLMSYGLKSDWPTAFHVYNCLHTSAIVNVKETS